MKNKSLHYIVLTIISVLVFSGCAKYNAGFLKQGYHDLTARYNSNFNAKQKYKLALKNLEQNNKDNFDELIPIYAYGTSENTKSQAAAFKVVIEKASKSIQLHKISNWSDDNFLLLGKAFYMQGEYEQALESLRYITANYKNGVDGRSAKKVKKQKGNKKRKARAKRKAKKDLAKLKDGKDIRPKKGFLKHSPAKSEALVWLVKTFTEKGDYIEAQAVLDYISAENTFIQNYDREKELAQSNYLIKQNLYSEAIPHLEKALEKYKSNKKKARYRFVLAQLYEKTGNKSSALNYYTKSIKGNSNFDMIFNAKLKALKINSGNADDDKNDRQLAKLIRDTKNSDYLDQLYFERALIAKKNKDLELAKEFLAKSIDKSTKNDKQKANSFALLGELFYQEENYTEAQANYAEALALIDTDFKDYNIIYKRANVLNKLVDNLNTIQKNDSLLTFASLPKKKLEQVLYEQASNLIEAQIEDQNSNKIIDKFAKNDKIKKSNKWYFYSENLKTAGYNIFISFWGQDRKLEDNWRRKNKNTTSDIAEEPKTEDEIIEEKINALYHEMLAEVPQTDSAKYEMNDNLAEAHFNAANIYKFDLENKEKSVYHYSKISKDFASSSYDAESLYNLYILKKEKNKKAADKYKSSILTKYPNSKYAKIIINPSYADKLKQDDIKVDTYYEETYQLYVAKNYREVLIRTKAAKSKFPNSKLEAKFALLEAITLGKQSKYDAYVNALETVINEYSDTEEQEKASEMLAYLKGETPKTKESETPKKVEEKEVKTNSIFDSKSQKDKEGVKVNFGKKEIFSVGTTKEEETENLDDKKDKTSTIENSSKKK